jgi:hypothetical protein
MLEFQQSLEKGEMNKISIWLLRIFLILAILFSGLEKLYSYLVFSHCHAFETNPLPRLIIQTTDLLTGHIIGFIVSVIFVYLMYKISVEIDRPLTVSVGVVSLAIAFSMYFSAFMLNFGNLQIL